MKYYSLQAGYALLTSIILTATLALIAYAVANTNMAIKNILENILGLHAIRNDGTINTPNLHIPSPNLIKCFIMLLFNAFNKFVSFTY